MKGPKVVTLAYQVAIDPKKKGKAGYMSDLYELIENKVLREKFVTDEIKAWVSVMNKSVLKQIDALEEKRKNIKWYHFVELFTIGAMIQTCKEVQARMTQDVAPLWSPVEDDELENVRVIR